MDKKKRFRSGLGFGVAMAVYFTLQNIWSAEELGSNTVFKAIAVGLVSGAVAGLLFGWLMGLFAKSKFVTQSTRIETEPGETILFESPANHFKGIEGVGGKLYLTNRRLVFKSHKLNIQAHELAINLADIRDAKRHKSLGIVNNGLSILTSTNVTEKFVVEQAGEWVKQLGNLRR